MKTINYILYIFNNILYQYFYIITIFIFCQLLFQRMIVHWCQKYNNFNIHVTPSMRRHVINLEAAKLNIFLMLQQRTSIDDQIVCDLRIFVSLYLNLHHQSRAICMLTV